MHDVILKLVPLKQQYDAKFGRWTKAMACRVLQHVTSGGFQDWLTAQLIAEQQAELKKASDDIAAAAPRGAVEEWMYGLLPTRPSLRFEFAEKSSDVQDSALRNLLASADLTRWMRATECLSCEGGRQMQESEGPCYDPVTAVEVGRECEARANSQGLWDRLPNNLLGWWEESPTGKSTSGAQLRLPQEALGDATYCQLERVLSRDLRRSRMQLDIFKLLPVVDFARAVPSRPASFVDHKALLLHLQRIANLSKPDSLVAYGDIQMDKTMLEGRNSVHCLLCLGEMFYEHAPLQMHCLILDLVGHATWQGQILKDWPGWKASLWARSSLYHLMVRDGGFRNWLAAQWAVDKRAW